MYLLCNSYVLEPSLFNLNTLLEKKTATVVAVHENAITIIILIVLDSCYNILYHFIR
jgi:hypothetical protein